MYPVLNLQAGKEAAIGFHHPWVFSGALEVRPKDVPHGSLVHVGDRNGRVIGTGTYSNSASIAIRIFEFKEAVIDRAWFTKKIREAQERRVLMGFGPEAETNGYRVVFGEADGIPGLVIDRYGDVVVFQIATAGVDAMREDVVAAIVEALKPSAVVERSDMSSRRDENLEEMVGVRHGKVEGLVSFSENGLPFVADVLEGQKTGFFLDQKVLRSRIGKLAKGRKALNLFSYSGAASIAAMKGGALAVHNIDGSEEALALASRQAEIHKIDPKKFTTETADIFQWLGEERTSQYGLVMIDPPALIKSAKDREEGAKAYHFLNRAAMRLVEDGGLFVTSSCSHFFSEEDLAFMLRRASVQAGIKLDILEAVRQAPDHPMSVYFPEGLYLKSFICRVTRTGEK